MHWACELNHVRIVDLLMKYAARIDCEDINSRTPLDLAISRDSREVLEHLIDHIDIEPCCYYKLLFAAVENFNYAILS
jgi:ankyrin repeat protein